MDYLSIEERERHEDFIENIVDKITCESNAIEVIRRLRDKFTLPINSKVILSDVMSSLDKSSSTVPNEEDQEFFTDARDELAELVINSVDISKSGEGMRFQLEALLAHHTQNLHQHLRSGQFSHRLELTRLNARGELVVLAHESDFSSAGKAHACALELMDEPVARAIQNELEWVDPRANPNWIITGHTIRVIHKDDDEQRFEFAFGQRPM